MQDLAPARVAARDALVDTIRRVYESHGFAPLATPALEAWEVLVGSGDADASEQVFGLQSRDDERLGLRFDLTVPLARFVAAHQADLPRPFRRYQVGPVWRQDKPGPGRFREFVQLDVDIVGTTSAVADAEIVAAMRDVFAALLPPDEKGSRFQVRLSDRRLLDGMLLRAGVPRERCADVLRVLDKLDRIGRAKVELELTSGYVDDSGDRVAGVGLERSSVEYVLAFLDVRGATRSGVLTELHRFFAGGARPTFLEGLTELCGHLDAMGVTDAEAALDVSVARGLAYYTGPVFETALRDAPSFGSPCSGGRYDDLVSRFSGRPWPGVGTSVGVDRLLAVLEHLGATAAARASCDVLVTTMDHERLPAYFAMARELRAAGLRAELFAGGSGSFGKQMKHADRSGAPVVVIAGGDEFAKGIVTVKRMAAAAGAATSSREEWLQARFGQREVPRADLVAAVKAALGAEGEAGPA
jgi:histidyl-tRNA synthetase